MHLSFVDYFQWFLGFFCQLCVAGVMVRQGTFRHFPVFFMWLTFEATKSMVLFSVFHSLGYADYYYAYWFARIISYVLQLSILAEILSHLLSPADDGAPFRTSLATLTLVCIVAVFFWHFMHPFQLGQFKTVAALEEVTGVIRCLVFIAICLSARLFGLRWRHHAIAIACGFGIFTGAQLLFAAFLTAFGQRARGMQYAISASFVCASLLWFQILKEREPERLSRAQVERALEAVRSALGQENNATLRGL